MVTMRLGLDITVIIYLTLKLSWGLVVWQLPTSSAQAARCTYSLVLEKGYMKSPSDAHDKVGWLSKGHAYGLQVIRTFRHAILLLCVNASIGPWIELALKLEMEYMVAQWNGVPSWTILWTCRDGISNMKMAGIWEKPCVWIDNRPPLPRCGIFQRWLFVSIYYSNTVHTCVYVLMLHELKTLSVEVWRSSSIVVITSYRVVVKAVAQCSDVR